MSEHEYAFDVKLAAVVRVRSRTLARAREAIPLALDAASLDVSVSSPSGRVTVTEASVIDVPGEIPTLFEVDGECVEEDYDEDTVTLSLSRNQTFRSFIQEALQEISKRDWKVADQSRLDIFMQHMVGAKLDLLLGVGKVEYHSATQGDAQYDRPGDFELEDVILHVTSAPTERLIEKCRANIDDFKRPVIVTLARKTAAAAVLAENVERVDQIEIVDFESIMISNLLERAFLKGRQQRVTVEELLEAYTRLVAAHDPISGVRIVLR